jgi:pimeloyl-ACP methyl ester carboxylesterase
LIPHAEKVIFDDCGHFLAIDKAEETAESIVKFFDRHCNNQEKPSAVVELD